jgi:hypothetical protein
MAPASGTALLILVAFVLPGSVTVLVSERTHALRDTDSSFERLLLTLYYSVLTYAILIVIAWQLGFDRSSLIRDYRGQQAIWKIFLAAALGILIVPLMIATIARIWLRSGVRRWVIGLLRINPGHRTPTAWDHFFEQENAALLRVTLNDGRVVGGYYGPGSFATYGEQARDLFISTQWILDSDAWFVRPAEASIGLWISKESIVSLEVYAVPDETTEAADTKPASETD